MPVKSSRKRALWPVALAGVALALGATRVAAIPVHGRVSLPRAVASATPAGTERARRDHYWNVWAELLEPASPRVATEREVSVVVTGTGTPRAQGCTYRIEGGDLLPRTMVAQANSRIALENRDGTAHRVYSDTLSDLTPLRTAPGRTRQISVPGVGSWELKDREYAQLGGHLVSLSDLVACASVTSRGEWHFRDLAVGNYTLKVYRAGREVHAAPLTVAANANEVVVDPILLPGT